MNLADYDYDLPAELIAQKPLETRDRSRLMVLPAGSEPVMHSSFHHLPEFLEKGDLLVLNDTRVFPARLIGVKEKTGGEAEIFLLRPNGDTTWEALSRPSKRLREGSVVLFGDGKLRAEIIEKGAPTVEPGGGHVRVRLSSDSGHIEDAVDAVGVTPLPPYIKRAPDENDRNRYQTIYARERGAVAAPTAGLHFSEELLEILAARGIGTAAVTLHVGIGTFRPLSEQEAENDRLHREYCRIPETTVQLIRECRAGDSRVIAVGTTTARALETASASGQINPFDGWTDLFIKPPHRFVTVGALITNFHLPRSSLLLMVSAFAGKDRIFRAYHDAIGERYRFYSYGDAMLIFGETR